MKKYFLLMLSLQTVVAHAQAQKSSKTGQFKGGIVVYTARISLGQATTDIDTLFFNQKESLFQWERKMQKSTSTTSVNGGPPTKKTEKIPPPDHIGRYNIYHAAHDSLFSRRYISGQLYLIKAPKPTIRWNITDSTKMLGNFKVIKATAKFRGRNYIAWFSPEIPVSYGPWKLIDLPGLILQVHDKMNKVSFKATKVKFKNIGDIETGKQNGKETIIGLSQYKRYILHRHKRAVRRARKIASKYSTAGNDKNSVEVHITNISVSEPMEIFDKSTGN